MEEEEEVAPSVTGQVVARWDERETDDGYEGGRQHGQCTAQSQRLWSGKKEVEVVGDVGEAFSLSLSLSLSDWDRRRSAEPRRIPITLYTDRVRNTMDETTSATCTTLQSNTGLVRASLAAHSSS